MSAIGWVDFSSEHREKVKSVIDLLSTPGVVDELGIGTIRDSFSDSLFPGISTIQTRAKYFLTIPRIFKDYERLPAHKRRRWKLSDYLNEHENRCMKAMADNHQNDPQVGIIGDSFANKQGEVQRKPSSIYWTGLRQFGLIPTNYSLQVFCRKFANPDQPLRDLVQGSDSTKGDDPDASEQANTTINGPEYDDDWIASLNVFLSHEEASFLSHQIEARAHKSLLGQILLDPRVRRQFVELPSDWNFTIFAAEAPFLHQFPDELQRTIAAAGDFWQLMRGAHVRYNVLLQQRHGTKALRDQFDAQWDEWQSELRRFPWQRWDTGDLWELTSRHRRRVRPHTARFVESWIDGIRSELRIAVLDELVIHQERNNKKSRARLQPASDARVGQWLGISELNYRLTQARTIVRDIHSGLTPLGGGDAGR